ncbi:MAG TPA: hypothetical protein VFZ00_28430 [Solirubrobacter sp.]|nr:hypothetical protein [Solirubrobacter sp.]
MSLKIAKGLALPDEFVTKTAAIVAKRRVGKTYTGAVFAEELVDAGLPFYALDPTSAWWGLRAGAGGQRRGGLPVVVIGGDKADVPLDPSAAGGRAIADLVVEQPSFYVIDLGQIETHADTVRFATGFLERLYRAKANHRDPLHGFWDEADVFAPQRPGPEETKMLGAAEAIVRRGGIRGLGTTVITQRPAVLNKNVLTQVDILIALRIIGPQDRSAVDEYLKGEADPDRRREVLDSLAGLGLGEAWVYGPGEEPALYERVQIRERRTFNSSATPKPGEKRIDPTLAEVDVAAVRRRLAETIEKTKADDPAELRKQLAAAQRDLRAERAKKPALPPAPPPPEPEKVPVLDDAHVERLEDAVEAMSGAASKIIAAANEISSGLAKLRQRPAPTPAAARPAAPPARRAPAAPAEVGDFRATTSQQRILDTLAWFEALGIDAPSRAALAPMAGTKISSGGFKNNLGALRTAGLLDYPTGGRVALTDAGRGVAAPPAIDLTDEALQDAVLAAVTNSQASILRELIAAYPNAMSREDLAERVGVPPTSGGFKNNLGALRTLEVLDYPSPGWVTATALLFPTEAAA